MDFLTWCDESRTPIGSHVLHALTARPLDLTSAISTVAELVPCHYAAEEQLARVLRRLGRPAAAEFIQQKLPTTKSIRSGDLGEILATEYIIHHTAFSVPIKRLRWKDHRNMAMRGDDIIGLFNDPTAHRLRFLKAEAKSRASLTTAVVQEARDGLDKDGGLPSAHALSFMSSRLMELGETELADAIDYAQLVTGIGVRDVTHTLFVVAGNNPVGFLNASLNAYVGPCVQLAVGVSVSGHRAFVGSVYDLVIANANNG